MNRRQFFVQFGFAAGALTVGYAVVPTPAAPMQDRFERCGWQVRWSGWREPVNQALIVGFWVAHHAGRNKLQAVTTMGATQELRGPLDVIDMSWSRDWEPLTVLATNEQRDAAKRRALNVLLEALT